MAICETTLFPQYSQEPTHPHGCNATTSLTNGSSRQSCRKSHPPAIHKGVHYRKLNLHPDEDLNPSSVTYYRSSVPPHPLLRGSKHVRPKLLTLQGSFAASMSKSLKCESTAASVRTIRSSRTTTSCTSCGVSRGRHVRVSSCLTATTVPHIYGHLHRYFYHPHTRLY